MVVVDVGPLVGGHALRHPPEPEQAQDVVDPDPARVPQDRAQHVPERGIARLGEPLRMPRRLRPVLPLLVVHVRRRAHFRLGGQHVAQHPGVRSERVHADCQVVDDAQGHAGPLGAGLSRLELLVEDPLQPAVEVDPVAQPLPQGVCRLVPRPQFAPQGGVHGAALPQRAPQREILETAPVLGPEGREPGVAVGTARDGIHQLQGLELARVCRVARHLGPVVIASGRLGPDERDVPASRGGEVDRLGDGLDAQVERVEEAPGRRQIGRGLHRRGRLGRVQRVDEDPVGPGGGADRRQVGQILDVADSPGPGGAHRIELGHQPPGVLFACARRQLVSGGDPVGDDDEGRLGVAALALGSQCMPPEWQPLGKPEGGLAHRRAVDLPWRGEVVALGDRPFGTGFVNDPDPDIVAVVQVDRDARGLAMSHDDRRGQQGPPWLRLPVGQGSGAGLLG